MAQPQLQSGRMTRFDCLEIILLFQSRLFAEKKYDRIIDFVGESVFCQNSFLNPGKRRRHPTPFISKFFFRSKVFIGGGVADNFYSIQLSSLPPTPTRPPAVELFRYFAKLWLTKLHHFPTCSWCCWLAVVSSPLNIDSTFCVEFTGEKASVSCCCCFQAHDIWSNDERIFAWVMIWC